MARAGEGSQLGRDVLVGRADGLPLLRAGARLSERYRRRLLDEGVMAVYIEDAESAGIEPEPVISDETRVLATRAVSGAYSAATAAMQTGKALDPRVVEALSDVVARMLRDIESSSKVALALADLSSADAYTFQHSIDVAALGLLIGQRHLRRHGWIDHDRQRRFDDLDERLQTLGLGLLLHDIGKLTVPRSVLLKQGPLTPPEWELIRAHPRTGVDLLAGQSWSPLVKAVVLRHHERWDGSGYPDGRAGEQIHQMARIAAVADVFDAITSTRVYQAARPASVGVTAIREGAGSQFDADVVDSFLGLVAPFPPGVELELGDGRRAVVVSVGQSALDRPRVRLLEGAGASGEIDLAERPELTIAGWEPAPDRPLAAVR